MGEKIDRLNDLLALSGSNFGGKKAPPFGSGPRTFSKQSRDKMSKSGSAMPDGSFPIPDVNALKRAIASVGRAKDPEAAKKHIISRAKALNAENLIPDDWKSGGSGSSDKKTPPWVKKKG